MTIVLKINGEDTNCGLVWVVDSSDIRMLDDCHAKLRNLLKKERLAGASLLVFSNKQDIQGAIKLAEIVKISKLQSYVCIRDLYLSWQTV
ncbi:hypothetical protein BDA96_09G077500 [Sorghum bicolor]|uniref:Uncharacterized protein n=1 Tax=Sorghum bicolor TaxID=4558 RepID=A0A921U465_SORBI|nr:hypothetical protein BDA96_09G077500 [Sorghum bicolor]